MMASNKIDSYRVSDVHTHITRDRSGWEGAAAEGGQKRKRQQQQHCTIVR